MWIQILVVNKRIKARRSFYSAIAGHKREEHKLKEKIREIEIINTIRMRVGLTSGINKENIWKDVRNETECAVRTRIDGWKTMEQLKLLQQQ
jgi:hypothetical protein